MLIAKLLGGLASILAVLALVAVVRGIPTRDLYFYDVYVILGPSAFLLLDALACGILAVLFFAISRWTLRPPNQLLGLVSFGLIVVSLFVLFAANFPIEKDLPPHESRLYALFGGLYGFLVGLGLLAANLAWALARTLVRKVRSHLSFR
jgi:hypothetical protein